MKRNKKMGIMGLGVILFYLWVPILLGQTESPPLPAPTTNVNHLFSIWAGLSLMGYSQSEIESLLENISPRVIQKVKHRLRLTVINKLNRLNVKADFERSTSRHDLRLAREKIRSEVRFAGLENDRHLRVMIRNRFGIPLSQI